MRILVISNYYPPFELGGWEQLVRDVTTILRGRGHQVHVLTSNYRSAEIRDAEDGVERSLHLTSPDHLHYHASYSLSYPWRERQNQRSLTRCVERFQPEIIFVHGMWNLPPGLARQAEQLKPGRVVYYLASPWPTEPNPHKNYWTDQADRRWRRLPKRLAGAVCYQWLIASGIEKLPRFQYVLCVSEYMRRHLAKEAGPAFEQAAVVYNGIDPSAFDIRPNSGEHSRLRLLFAGQLRYDKGAHTAIEAAGIVIRQNPELPISLTLRGEGPPEYVDGLRKRIDELDLGDVVSIQGWAAYEEMPGILRDHDALLFCSIWPEPIARIVQEAMASGLVIIGTPTGGTPEILVDGMNGLTFDPGSAEMLAAKIFQIARQPDLRRKLSSAARNTVLERFTLTRMVKQIEEHFHSVLCHDRLA